MNEHLAPSPAELFRNSNLSLYPTLLQRCPDLAISPAVVTLTAVQLLRPGQVNP